jgi:Flp pilus assembly protein TadD
MMGTLVALGGLGSLGCTANAQAPIQLPSIAPLPGTGLPSRVGGVKQNNPTSITTIAQQASRLISENQPAMALEMLDKGLETAPRDPQLRFLKGVALTDSRKTEGAILEFTSLTQEFPELPEPYNNLAVLYANLGDLNKARDALEAAVRALPTYSLAHENLGDLYLRMAARQYENAGKANPKNTLASQKLSLAREWVNQVVKINVQ